MVAAGRKAHDTHARAGRVNDVPQEERAGQHQAVSERHHLDPNADELENVGCDGLFVVQSLLLPTRQR